MTAVLDAPPDLDLQPAEPETETPGSDGDHKECELMVSRPLFVVFGQAALVLPTLEACHVVAQWLGSWMCGHGRDQTVRACEEHHDYLVEHPGQLSEPGGSNPTVLWARP